MASRVVLQALTGFLISFLVTGKPNAFDKDDPLMLLQTQAKMINGADKDGVTSLQNGTFNIDQPRPGLKIMYHHIWKCGGTHFCDVAHDAGFRAPNNDGCHRWTDPSATLDLVDDSSGLWRACALAISKDNTEVDEIRQTPFNFYGHECPVTEQVVDEGMTAGFTWVTILRDPLEQVTSWYRHVSGQASNTFANVGEWIVGNTDHVGGFMLYEDNIQTRWLAGGNVTGKQLCSLKECPDLLPNPSEAQAQNDCSQCFDLAKAALRKMVGGGGAVLELRGRQIVGMEKLYELGWPEPTVPQASFDEEESDATTDHVALMEQGERSQLERAQSVDIALIEWARAEGILTPLSAN